MDEPLEMVSIKRLSKNHNIELNSITKITLLLSKFLFLILTFISVIIFMI